MNRFIVVTPDNDSACCEQINELTEDNYDPHASGSLKGIYNYLKTYHLDFYAAISDRSVDPRGFILKAIEYLQNLEVNNE